MACYVLLALAATLAACHRPARHPAARIKVTPFGFQITSAENKYQIEGYFARGQEPGRLPALLVLNGNGGDARQCIARVDHLTSLAIRVACISLPGYGKSSGPARFVGPQSVEAARRGLELLAARADVDPARLAIWGIADGATAAGLLMDSDQRARTVILQSGEYDMLKLWPHAPLGTKLAILRQVWPSRRALKERSVVENLPPRLDCSVLILHGRRDRKTPLTQAEQLARALRLRGARVETDFFPRRGHQLGNVVGVPLTAFLRANLTPNAGARRVIDGRSGPGIGATAAAPGR